MQASVLGKFNYFIFSVQVKNSTLDVVDASEWFEWNESFITVYPKWEQLDSNNFMIYYIVVNLTSDLQTSFKLNITLNKINKVWSQTNINFTAGVAHTYNLLSLINIENVTSIVLSMQSNTSLFDTFYKYSPESFDLSIQGTSNANLGNIGVVLLIKDSSGNQYQTNSLLLMIVLNHPPTAFNQILNQIFYKGNLNNTILFNNQLFYDDDNLSIITDECNANNSKIVSFSVLKFDDFNQLKSIKIFFVDSFIGSWTYGLVGTDLISQKSIINFNITVISWAQTDCISCNGPYQSNCTIWRDGYKLMDDGVWVQVDSTNPFKTTQYIYITLLVICNIVLSVVASFLDWPSEISHLVIYSNQAMLILLLISDTQSSNLANFMSALQLVKLDLKFLDSILNLRSIINSVFYKEQYTNMQSLNFESGSTFANYSNALLVCFVFLVLYFIALAVKCWENKLEINVLTKYINVHVKLQVYITYVKLCFSIILINCISELINQITLDEHGDFKSYIFCDVLLIIAIWWMFVSSDSKLSKSIFKNKSMHTKVNLAKMLVYSFAFTFRNSWRFSK